MRKDWKAMVATTDLAILKARLLDLTTGVLEMCRDGARDIERVCDVLQIVKDDPDFAERLLGDAVVVPSKPEVPAPTVTTFALTVDYDAKVEARVKKGKYDYANPNITAEHFPATRKGKATLEACLVHFNRFISTEDAEQELDRLGFRPGELPELLAFGAQFPDVQREFPVVETGSRWQDPDGYWLCACLWSDAADRLLRLNVVEGGWGDDYRFLAFRK